MQRFQLGKKGYAEFSCSLSSDASAVALITDRALYYVITTRFLPVLIFLFCLDKKSSREEIQMSNMGSGMEVGKRMLLCWTGWGVGMLLGRFHSPFAYV